MFELAGTSSILNLETYQKITHKKLLQHLIDTSFNNRMARSKGPKFYAVRKGRQPGVYNTWAECQAQTRGFSCAVFKSFPTMGEAKSFVGGGVGGGGGNSTSASRRLPALRTNTGASHSHKVGDDNDDDAIDLTSSPTKKRKLSAKDTHEDGDPMLSILIHFDGGSRGNPGLAGAGACLEVVHKKSSAAKKVERKIKIRQFCGMHVTNNVAEYTGLVVGLREAYALVQEFYTNLGLSPHGNIDILVDVKGDSNLIINQMNGVYSCKHPKLKPIYAECTKIVRDLAASCKTQAIPYDGNLTFKTEFSHVYRDKNKVADALANEAMDARRSWVERTEGGEDHMKSKKKGRASQHLDDDDDDGPSYVAVNEFTSVTSTATLPHSCEYVLEDV